MSLKGRMSNGLLNVTQGMIGRFQADLGFCAGKFKIQNSKYSNGLV